MAHLIEQMFSVSETPWHGLGHIVQTAPTTEEAIKLAGLDWTVSKRPVFMDVPNSPDKVEIASHKAITRDSDGTVFNVLSNNYEPLQNQKAFEFFDHFVAQGLARYETAGSLDGGKKVWILASINRDPMVIGGDDTVKKFILLANGHDGMMAFRGGFTPIRTVCANTLKLAIAHSASQLIRINHTKQIEANVEALRGIMDVANQKFDASAEVYRKMAATGVNAEDLEKFVRVTFETKKIADPEVRKARELKLVGIVTKHFETGLGSDLVTAKGTVWGLYNAVTEYLSYEQGNSADTRMKSLWFGDSAQTNQRALQAAIDMVA